MKSNSPLRIGHWIPLLCAAAAAITSTHAAMTIESLSGPVTATEISTFKTHMASRTMANDNFNNQWAYGSSGMDMEALGQMYEITGDRAILDRMIQYADKLLSFRNDMPGGEGRVMWTGKVEPVWPNDPTGTSCAGSEQGDALGHLAYCAKLILLTPSIWSTTVGAGDPQGYGTTYKARAQKYVTEVDKTLDQYITPHFVRTAESYHLRFPADTRYTGANNNGAIPWNQQAMMENAYINMADCHEILKDSPTKVTLFRNIVANNIDWFLSDLHPYTAGGKSVYDWGYSLGRTGEDVGHGQYDMWGLCRAYHAGLSGATAAQMTSFANTLYYVIWDPAISRFHKRVDGTDGSDTPSSNINPAYTGLARFLTSPDLYTLIATQNRSRAGGDPIYFAFIMTEKHRRALTANGEFFSRHYRIIARHSSRAVVVQSASTADGANVIQWGYTSSSPANDEWTINKLPSGHYQILNRHSRKALNVSGASMVNAGNVIQWPFGATALNDQWTIDNLGNGFCRIIARHSGKVLNVSGASTTDGANVDQWSWANVNQQQFQLIPVP